MDGLLALGHKRVGYWKKLGPRVGEGHRHPAAFSLIFLKERVCDRPCGGTVSD